MSAREEILASVRRALADADTPWPTVPRGYRSPDTPADRAALVDLFVERVEDYRAIVTRCGPDEVSVHVTHALTTAGATRIVVPDGLDWQIDGAGADTGQSAAQLDEMDAVVTGASVAIASTGTIVLSHGPGQGRRALTLVPDVHVCVVREAQVCGDVPEAVALLDPVSPQTWISGPSATSDIELQRVEGVHGPRTLHVLVVGEDVG